MNGASSKAAATTTTTAAVSSRAPPFGSRASAPVAIPEFTEEDYYLYLQHPQWSREDTLSLLDAVRIFDCEWNLVASTFNGDPRRTPVVRSLTLPPSPFTYLLVFVVA